METTMIRVRSDIRELLRDLAHEQGTSMQDILARALEEYRRALIFDQADRSYAALRADPIAWTEELEERAAWDGTLADGLEPVARSEQSRDINDISY